MVHSSKCVASNCSYIESGAHSANRSPKTHAHTGKWKDKRWTERLGWGLVQADGMARPPRPDQHEGPPMARRTMMNSPAAEAWSVKVRQQALVRRQLEARRLYQQQIATARLRQATPMHLAVSRRRAYSLPSTLGTILEGEQLQTEPKPTAWWFALACCNQANVGERRPGQLRTSASDTMLTARTSSS